MDELTRPKVGRLSSSEQVVFGPDAYYHPLIGDSDTSVRTGIQTSNPGYVAPMHSHSCLDREADANGYPIFPEE